MTGFLRKYGNFMKKMNCWEFFKCGRQPGGEMAEKFGVCPVPVSNAQDGVNHGKHAGRVCWVVAGTYCDGACHGTYSEKLGNCLECVFMKKVTMEEERNFVLLPDKSIINGSGEK